MSNGSGDLTNNVSFNFTATVTSSADPLIQVGDTDQGAVIYDPTEVGSSGVYTFTGSTKTHTFNFKDLRGGVQITADQYAGQATSPYQIIMTIVNNVTQMEITGLTAAGRTVGMYFTANANLGLTLPTSMANFNTSSGTFVVIHPIGESGEDGQDGDDEDGEDEDAA